MIVHDGPVTIRITTPNIDLLRDRLGHLRLIGPGWIQIVSDMIEELDHAIAPWVVTFPILHGLTGRLVVQYRIERSPSPDEVHPDLNLERVDLIVATAIRMADQTCSLCGAMYIPTARVNRSSITHNPSDVLTVDNLCGPCGGDHMMAWLDHTCGSG